MKITIYELLGMVKDGKAPKKIKYDELIWEYTGYQYQRLDKENLGNIWNGYNFNILDNEVEILEEEKKIPEKSNIDFNTKLPVSGCNENEAFMMTCISHLGKTIDSLIDYLKSKGDE